MDNLAADRSTIFEPTAFLIHFNGLPDPRQAVKGAHPLGEVQFLSLLSMLAGTETFTGIARSATRSWRFRTGSARSAMAEPPLMSYSAEAVAGATAKQGSQ